MTGSVIEEISYSDIVFAFSSNLKLVVIAGVIGYVIVCIVFNRLQIRRNEAKISRRYVKFERKKDKLRKHLSDLNGTLMTEERKRILSYPISTLTSILKDGGVSPLQVLNAYQAMALECTKETNCIVDFFDECEEIAVALEDIPPIERGPLYGLPISVKECFMVQGYDHNIGLVKLMDCPAEDDGSFIKVLRKLHAIPFCLTNVPQTLHSYGCSNPIYGCTTHPMDKSRSPGGSSGGEACLIAQGGSIIGIGSDVGGSLRIPAHFCGIAALKPTRGRLCERGRLLMAEAVGVKSNCGFMARSVDGVILGMKAMLRNTDLMVKLDHTTVPISWKENQFNSRKKLTIGWYDDDGFFPVTPACKRAISFATTLLESRGHQIKHFKPPNIDKIVMMFCDHMLADGGKNALRYYDGEILDQSIEFNNLVYRIPMFVKRFILGPVLRYISPIIHRVASAGKTFSGDLMDSLFEKEEIKEKILKAWNEEEIDVLIGPVMPFPAPPIKYPGRLVPAASYTAVYNVLNFPAGSVPVTRVIRQDEDGMISYPTTGDILFSLVQKGMRDCVGLPLNVQVIGQPWQEEIVLHVMKELEESAGFHTIG